MRSSEWINKVDTFFKNNDIDINWLENLESFCKRYNLNLQYILEILNDPKVIPMIRGKSFEFTVSEYLKQILSNQYEILNPRLNAQVGLHDIDVSIVNKDTSQIYTVECKLASKGSFKINTFGNPLLKVKCMRSRTLGLEAALYKSRTTGLPYDSLIIHNDQYTTREFDFVVTSIANAFFETDDNGLFYWSPSINANAFLSQLKINNQEDAFYKMYVARSRDMAANQPNQIKCSRKKCQDLDCNFIPNYPVIYFDKITAEPLKPWISLENIESLFS